MVPSSAVTTTLTLLTPAVRPVLLVTAAVATLLVGTTATVACVVPNGRSKDCSALKPVVKSVPFTVTEAIVFTLDGAATITLTVYTFTVPSSAVTVTVTVLVPRTRLVFPAAIAVAYALVGTTSTVTDDLPRPTFNEPPSTTFLPSILKVLREVSLENSPLKPATTSETV